MKTISIFSFLFSTLTFSQITVFEDNFDSYIINQGIASQATDWYTWSGPTGTVEDAHASDDYAYSPMNSMKIINNRDMHYKFGDISSGLYSIEFNILIHEQAYFSVQHDKGSNWAFDIWFNYDNEIIYKDEYYINDVDTVANYVTDQWINLKFEINFYFDVIFFFVDNVMVHSSTFSNSINSTPSSNLDIINFYGLSGLNGVVNSDYYIDDFKVTNLVNTANLATYTKKEINVFPNPAKDVVTITTADNLKQVRIYDLSGKIIFEENAYGTNYQFSLNDFSPGIYSIFVTTEKNTSIEKLVVE